uniref:lysozyme C, milk isozyme-like n=1 Tax=Euleptes europaea TaxID=460621 RepID=UPI00254095A8|nr:lysozyme C, milk isozyme-like [Euleptes europaea]
MKVQALTALFFLLVAANEAKVMKKCELVKILKQHGMDKHEGYKLGDWVCMAYHESRYNTKAVGAPNTDRSRDYGIFQINSKYWCTDGKNPSSNGCKKPCSSFTNDNIEDDIVCAKRIVRDPQKMNAWVGWVKHCKGKDLSQWTQGCK